MHKYIPRTIADKINRKFLSMPAVAILGPRQAGKTTLAQQIIAKMSDAVYLDLERPADRNKLRDPEAFFEINRGRVVCLDEIQCTPDIFVEMRSQIDRHKRNGRFLVLGSASPDLLRQSSETLAGRIAFTELSPFSLLEISRLRGESGWLELWLRGGFPRSYLAHNQTESYEWRQDFIRTFLERDIPQLGINISSRRLEHFWQMCAHVHGQLLNRSRLGESLGVSHHTISNYLGLLEGTYLTRILPPFYSNLKKRLVKSPKVYLRDSGLLHALLGVESHNDLLGHPVRGASWEGFVIENAISALPGWKPFFYRSASGAEIDLVLVKGDRRLAIEIKVSTSPEVKPGFWHACRDLNITKAIIVAPVEDPYPYKGDVYVIPLSAVTDFLP